MPNQMEQELVVVVQVDGRPQLQVKASFADLGINPNRVYYVGFTSAQHLSPQVATGTLSIVNFRVFKTYPKFVDGQVS